MPGHAPSTLRRPHVSPDGAIGRFELRVRYAETDQMGRAHHAHYLVWCEAARTAFMRERGVSYAELEERGVRLPVSRIGVEYRQGVGYDELVRVETRVQAVRSRSVRFGYRILRVADGTLLATAETELVCTGAEGRPARLPGRVRETLEEAVAGPRSDLPKGDVSRRAR